MDNANSWSDLDDDDDDLEMDQTTQSGSKLLKDLRKQLKVAAKEKKEMAEQMAQLQSSIRNRTIGDVLAGKGLPSKIAKLMPSDLEPTAESVEAWLNEFGDVFGASKEGQEPAGSQEAAGETAPQGVSTENVDALQRMGQTQLSSTTPPVGAQQQQLAALSNPDLTPEQLDQLVFAAKKG